MTGPLRIVVAGEMVDGAAAPALAQGFRECGWVVEKLDLIRFVRHAGGLAGRVLTRLTFGKTITDYNRGIIRAVERDKTDVFLFAKGTFIRPATLRSIREAGVLVAQFYPDVEFTHSGLHSALSEECDLVFTTKSFHMEYLEERLGRDRVRFIHHGFDPLVHRNRVPAGEDEFAREVVFIGNFSAYKLDYLKVLAGADLGRVSIMGHGWAAAKDTSIARFIEPRAPTGDDYAVALGHSRMAIALHHGPVRTQGWEDLVSTRSFEIPACGAMMLHIDNVEIRNLFEPGVECDVFSGPGDLLAQLRRYRARPDERCRIALAGHTRALRDHSYWSRARDMADELTGRVRKRRLQDRCAPHKVQIQ